MTERVIIAGAGGQGVMLLGKILAQSAMEEDKFVTWLPAYGPEVRGGTAHCMVIISDKEISSPCIDKADTLVIMNSLSLEKFKARVRSRGLLVINSSLAPQGVKSNARVFKYPFSGVAVKLGNIKVANMVALGYYLAKRKIIEINTVLKVIEDVAPEDKQELITINKQALIAGNTAIIK